MKPAATGSVPPLSGLATGVTGLGPQMDIEFGLLFRTGCRCRMFFPKRTLSITVTDVNPVRQKSCGLFYKQRLSWIEQTAVWLHN